MFILHLVTSRFDFTLVLTQQMDYIAPVWIYMYWIYVIVIICALFVIIVCDLILYVVAACL